METYVGIDVAKVELVVCLLKGDEQHEITVANSKTGLKKLQNWLKKRGARGSRVCLEATGIYSDLAAEILHKGGYIMSVVNPARISAYAQSQLKRNKTDQIDAALIADFVRTQSPATWTPPTPEVVRLKRLVRHLESLKEERQRVHNRLETQSDQEILKQLKAQIALLVKQIKQTEQLIQDHIDNNPDLKKQADLLQSIPGIGLLTSAILLAELGDWRRFDNVREMVAFCGLNPRQRQSGRKRQNVGISRTGRAALRAALFMPALVAKRHNPILHDFALRLENNGLALKQVVVAVMRKLIHLTYGILKSGRAFDPNYGKNLAPAA